MSVESILLAALTQGSPAPTSAGDNVYANLMPQTAVPPSVSFQRISTVPYAAYAGDSGIDDVRMQVDCWAATYAGARQLAREVRAALIAAGMEVFLDNAGDEFEQETRLYRVRMDFLIKDTAALD